MLGTEGTRKGIQRKSERGDRRNLASTYKKFRPLLVTWFQSQRTEWNPEGNPRERIKTRRGNIGRERRRTGEWLTWSIFELRLQAELTSLIYWVEPDIGFLIGDRVQ